MIHHYTSNDTSGDHWAVGHNDDSVLIQLQKDGEQVRLQLDDRQVSALLEQLQLARAVTFPPPKQPAYISVSLNIHPADLNDEQKDQFREQLNEAILPWLLLQANQFGKADRLVFDNYNFHVNGEIKIQPEGTTNK